jgi:hypothetical protein
MINYNFTKMMTSISKKLVSEAEKIRLRKRDLRGLIRNNLSLLNIMTEDLTIYLSRLPKSKQNQVNKYIKWFLANLDELVRRVELSFSIESEDTREDSNIITIPSPPDDIPPEVKAEDDINISLKVIKDVLISLRENKIQLYALGTIDPSEGMTSQIMYTFDNMAVAIREKLKLREPPSEPHSQMGRVLTEMLIVANRDHSESMLSSVEQEV